MRVLYIYRHKGMGFSIGKVFHSIEQRMKFFCTVSSIYMPTPDYKLNNLWANVRYVRKHLRENDYDIIHITGSEYYLIPFLKIATRSTIVATVHDLGFYTNQHFHLSLIWKYLLWIKTLKLADKITFISKKSLLEAERLVKFDKGQVKVIHNPVGNEFSCSEKKLNQQCPVVLQVGTGPNKNLDNTIIALRDLPCRLRIIGKLNEQQRILLKIYGIDYSNVYDLSDDEIKQEYEQCDIVNFPSFYEGFGMPIVEGQATGRVVITSNLSPMKDIAGCGAVLVNPLDVDSIRVGYQLAMTHATGYIKFGLENVTRYEISKIVSEYLNLYRDLCHFE